MIRNRKFTKVTSGESVQTSNAKKTRRDSESGKPKAESGSNLKFPAFRFPLSAFARITILLLLACSPLTAQDTFTFTTSCKFRFATREEGIAAITQDDAYTRNFSRFDLQARLNTDQPVTVEDWKPFVARQVEEWNDADRQRLLKLLNSLRKRFAKFSVPLPDEVLLVATTGKEESSAAFCRGRAVILPTSLRSESEARLESVLIHELFHVSSNQHPEMRADMYRIVGFEQCAPLEIHRSLRDRRISNPDAPLIDCVMELPDGERVFHVAPVIYASVAKFDPRSGGTMFRFLEFRLMVVQRVGDTWQAADRMGQAMVIDPKNARVFHDKIGANTKYIIHPEEILADNFVHMILENKNLANPNIVEQLQKVLASKAQGRG